MAVFLEMLAYAGLAILTIWIPLNYLAYNSFARLIGRGEIRRALWQATVKGQWPLLRRYLARELALPDEKLRPLILGAIEQLVALQNALGENNPIPAALQNQAQTQISAAFEAIYGTCARLSIVAKQGLQAEALRAELELEAAKLRQLSAATEAASVELARLTLLAGSQQVPQTSQQFGQLGWAAGELQRLERQLED